MIKWTELSKEKPETGIPVICFNPEWINEDFNPKGIREGFLNGDNEFTTSYWWDHQDCYVTISDSEISGNELYSDEVKENTEPTHWMHYPKNPLELEKEINARGNVREVMDTQDHRMEPLKGQTF